MTEEKTQIADGVASVLNAELGIFDKEKDLAKKDAEVYGIGYLVNGLRVHPSRVVVFKNKEEQNDTRTI